MSKIPADQPDPCWVITDGKAGNRSQAIGLAEALEIPFAEKTIKARFPWNRLPARFWPLGIFGLETGPSDPLNPPWPQLTISCGGRAVGPALAVKQASGGMTKSVHMLHPHVPFSRFDLVAVPEHDSLSGPNVVTSLGAVNRISAKNLAESRTQFQDRYKDLPRPLIAVLIGGDNKAFTLTPEFAETFATRMLALAIDHEAGIVVTASRRTGSESGRILRNRLKGPMVDFWDGSGDNPYFGMLALADAIVVTGDSVNMISEACTSGKPVYVAPLPIKPGRDRAARKFLNFHKSLAAAKAILPFDGPFDPTMRTVSLAESEKIAAAVKAIL